MDNATIDRELRDVLDRAVAQRGSRDVEPLVAIEHRVAKRRRRRVVGGALAAGIALLIVSVGVVLSLRGDGGDERVDVASPPTDEPQGADGPIVSDPSGVQVFPSAPLEVRGDAAVVWTGDEVVVWGGDVEELNMGLPGPDRQYRDGAAFDPATETWRAMSPSPLPATFDSPVGTTTDMGVLLVRGTSTALWDPGADSWRALDDAPAPVSDVAFTGSTAISHSANAELDLETGTWEMLPGPPVSLERPTTAWTGKLLVVVGGPDTPFTSADAIAYDPEAGEWREIAQPPADLFATALSADWDGDSVVVVNYDMRSAEYVPATDSWSDLPFVPARFSEWYPILRSTQGNSAVFMANAIALLTSAGEWRPIPYGEIRGGQVAGPRSALSLARSDDTLFVWGLRDEANELVGLDLSRLTSEPTRTQVGAGSVEIPDGWSIAAANYEEASQLLSTSVQVDLAGPSGEGCTVRSTYLSEGAGIEEPIEVELVNDGNPRTWLRDSAGRIWQSSATTYDDTMVITCGEAATAEALARSASGLPTQP